MVQKYFSLAAEGAAIKFSVSSLSLAGGGLIEGIGITPSVESILPSELESRFAFLTEENDPQIIDAITTLAVRSQQHLNNHRNNHNYNCNHDYNRERTS